MLDLYRTRAGLEELGHALDWRLVGPVAGNRPGDPGWEATLDGKIIARGGAHGLLVRELEESLAALGFDVSAWRRPGGP